jgi:putative hemolysin
MSELFLPIDLYNTKSQRDNLLKISKMMKNDECVIFFPAGMVSRLVKGKIRDPKWNKGAITIARKFNSPILPIYISGRNSYIFYILAKIKDIFATFLLPGEMFRKKNYTLNYKFGKLITPKVFEDIKNDRELTEILREYVYKIDVQPKKLEKYIV